MLRLQRDFERERKMHCKLLGLGLGIKLSDGFEQVVERTIHESATEVVLIGKWLVRRGG